MGGAVPTEDEAEDDVPRIVTAPSWFGRVRVLCDPDGSRPLPWFRLRGRRRYDRALAARRPPHMDELSGWYDYFHQHPDMDGRGNESWRARRAHLELLFAWFRHALTVSRRWDAPHQVWASIDPWDSGNDAVFVHSPNENRDNFPHRFEGVDWEAPVPPLLRPLLTDPTWQFGRCDATVTYFHVRERSPAAPRTVALP